MRAFNRQNITDTLSGNSFVVLFIGIVLLAQAWVYANYGNLRVLSVMGVFTILFVRAVYGVRTSLMTPRNWVTGIWIDEYNARNGEMNMKSFEAYCKSKGLEFNSRGSRQGKHMLDYGFVYAEDAILAKLAVP